jgi:hypothetical protein
MSTNGPSRAADAPPDGSVPSATSPVDDIHGTPAAQDRADQLDVRGIDRRLIACITPKPGAATDMPSVAAPHLPNPSRNLRTFER